MSERPEDIADAVNTEGYAFLHNVLDPATCKELIAEVDRIEAEYEIPFGTNEFEGLRTRRIFNLISRSEPFRALVLNERLLAAMEAILGVDFLLSGTTSMHICPGETQQLLHPDDGMVSLPRPHPATLITTLWALNDFTEDVGATRVVPRTHLEETIPQPGPNPPSIPAEMPAGSAVVMHGSTWHGGGANTTADRHRYGVSIQFVAGWCRQQQNLQLGTPQELVRTYPRRLQELIGYSIYLNVMGHVNRKHPLTLLGEDTEVDMIWDKLTTQAEE
jgi:ectoine hydroxylase-related dioxygenase (phytanoyl-CoA dioxygenase family)